MSNELTFEQVKEILRYDSETGLLARKLKSGRWKPCGDKPGIYGYGRVWVDGKRYFTHKMIWLLVYGSWPSEIDHIDRNRMNNCINNLRRVSSAENSQNQGLRRDNSTGYPGVYWDKQRNKYRAQIRVDNKLIRLGRFTTPEEAFLTYQLAKIELHPSSPIAQEYLKELTFAG